MVEAARRGDIEVLWSSGGNFLDVLPAPDITRTALARTPLRVHQDIVITHQMLVEPGETVVLLPAATRYEQAGGGTSTTTERRVAFSPEIDGPKVGEARSEYAIFLDVARRVHPERADRLGCDTAQEIREEIAASSPRTPASSRCGRPATRSRSAERACVKAASSRRPTGAPTSALSCPSDPKCLPAGSSSRPDAASSSIPWCGRTSTRSPGAGRDALLLSESDAVALGVGAGDAVLVRSPHGEMRARAHIAPMRAGNVQAFFPEANVLLAPNRRDPISGVPDYNAVVEVVPIV